VNDLLTLRIRPARNQIEAENDRAKTRGFVYPKKKAQHLGPDFPRKQITQKGAEVKNPLRNAFFFISRSIKLDNLAKMLHLTKERRNI